jgi:hypothetical protein
MINSVRGQNLHRIHQSLSSQRQEPKGPSDVHESAPNRESLSLSSAAQEHMGLPSKSLAQMPQSGIYSRPSPRVQPEYSRAAWELKRKDISGATSQEKGDAAERVMRITSPSANDDKSAGEMKKEYRQAYLRAQSEYKEALEAMNRLKAGGGAESFHNGSLKRQELSRTKNGNVLIKTTLPDGAIKTAEINPEKHPGGIEVTTTAGTDRNPSAPHDTLYRYGETIRLGPDIPATMRGEGPTTRYEILGGEIWQHKVWMDDPANKLTMRSTTATVSSDGKSTGHAPPSKVNLEDRKAKLDEAMKNSEIPSLRQHITNNPNLRDAQGRPIDGTGQVIGYIDPQYNDFLDKATNHAFLTEAHMNTQDEGVAPGAKVQGFNGEVGGEGSLSPSNKSCLMPGFSGPTTPPDEPVVRDSPREVGKALENLVSSQYSTMALRMDDILKRREPDMNVLNMSISTSRSMYMTQMFAMLNHKNKAGEFSYPRTRQALFGADHQQVPGKVMMQKTAAFVTEKFNEPRGQIKQAQTSYQQAAKNLSEAGVSIVVAADNSQTLKPPGSGDSNLPPWSEVMPGAGLNLYAMSEDVITVAASNSQNTPGPGRRGDDTIWVHSSRGEGAGGWNPTIAAPGENIVGHNMVMNGTSGAAPYVSGVIALMKQANPSLTSQDVRGILRGTATDIKMGEADQGAGVINPEQAVEEALRRDRLGSDS